MEAFEFHNPVKLIFGPGQVSRTGQEASNLGSKALVVSYREHDFFAELLENIQSMLKDQGLRAAPFFEVTANPTIGQVRRGVEICKSQGADLVIGVGGGSAMDVAKLIAAAVYREDDPWNMVVSRHDRDTAVPPKQALPLLMVPTFPATGSEMNCCAVITNENTKEKSYSWAPCLFPKVSIVDPSLTCSLSRYQTACGAADTISHVMEFYLNGMDDAPLQNRIQEGVVLTVMDNVYKALANPNDISCRSHLQWSSIVALNGWAHPGDAWTPMHQLGHVLSARYDLAHGVTLSIIMPAWMKCLYNRRLERYLQFAQRIFDLTCNGSNADTVMHEAITRFEAFLKDIGVPTRLSEVDIAADDLDTLTEDVVRISFGKDGMLNSRPPISRDDIKDIFQQAL